MTDVVTVVTEVLGVDRKKVTDEMIAALDAQLKLKSAPREKMLFAQTDVDVGEIKLAPQAKVLYDSLNETEDPVTLETWAELAKDYGLHTKQEPIRIVSYYRKQLVDTGLINETPVS